MTTPGYFMFTGEIENFMATKESNGVPLEKTITLKNGDFVKGTWENDEGAFADLIIESGWTLKCVAKVLFRNVVAYKPRNRVK